MPNPNNINAPITLIANGRSGTSLIQSVFKHHPAFDVCGETAALVFGTWHATERLKGIVRGDHSLGKNADFGLRCGKAVRAVMLETFRAPGKRFWMQKPIGMPWVWHMLGQYGLDEPAKAAWYWQVLHQSFPEGTNITVLRHPYDVVLSAQNYWGITSKQAWSSVVGMARILGHPAAKIQHAVVYDLLVEEPLAETERLFAAINRPFNPASLQAFAHIWVPEMGTLKEPLSPGHPRSKAKFSRKQDWSKLDVAQFPQEERDVIIAMWARYGVGLTL